MLILINVIKKVQTIQVLSFTGQMELPGIMKTGIQVNKLEDHQI